MFAQHFPKWSLACTGIVVETRAYTHTHSRALLAQPILTDSTVLQSNFEDNFMSSKKHDRSPRLLKAD